MLYQRIIFMLLIPLALLSCFPLCAQRPDLVPLYEENLKNASNDSARAMALQYLAFNLAHTDPERSVRFGDEALRVAEGSGNPWLLAQCQNGVGWAFFSGGNYSRARVLLDSAIQYMRATQDYFDLAPVCNNQGWVCMKQGDNLGALRYFREGLIAAEASKDKGRIGFMNRSMSSFYNAQKEYDKSIAHIEKALEIFTTLNDPNQISDCLLTLGNAYSGLEQHETAISYYKRTLPYTKQSQDFLGEALIYENWGISLSRLGRFAEAFTKFDEAMALLKKLNEQIEIAYLHFTIGSTFMLKGDTLKAIPSLEHARLISSELNLADILSETLPALHSAYFAVGASEKAYKTLLAFQTIRDTTAVEERHRDLQRLKTEYETERKEKDLQIKILENTRLQFRFWLALAGFGLALLIGFAFWYRARQRRITNAALEAKNLEILAQKTEAERLRERAEQSEAVKEKFLAAMSHEIRTPMNAIVGLSQLLDAQEHNPTITHNISIIRQSSEQLMTILNDVLDLAKIEANKMELRPKDLHLPSQLRLITGTFESLASEKGLELKLEIDPEVPEFVVADPVRLGQILNNLVSNAIKFTHQGNITLSVKREEPADTASPDASVTFAVSDTGIGIPTNRQEAIFEEFIQVEDSMAVTQGGTGLGLSIVRGLVAQMGGTLQIWSQPGKGSRFFFTIPLKTGKAEEVSDNDQKTVVPALSCLKVPHILVVEDNLINQMVVNQSIAAICPQIELCMVTTGEMALEKARMQPFDLIFTDLQMPGMDGFETARKLRALPFNGPILALTASAIRADESRCKAAGMQEMLLKPVSPTEMANVLLRYLPDHLIAERKIQLPKMLIQYSGSEQNAKSLISLICKEWSQFLKELPAFEKASDVESTRKWLHKLKPQLIVMELEEESQIILTLEQNPISEEQFWVQLKKLQSTLDRVVKQYSQ